jgi:hypothetical protein
VLSGCSNGGRQAQWKRSASPTTSTALSRAPAYDFTGIGAQFIKDIRAAFPIRAIS